MKISILKDKLAVYESLVWLSMWRRPRSEQACREAFLYIFQAKSRSLADHLVFQFGALSGQAPELQILIQDTRRDLNWYYREIERKMLEAGSSPVGQIEILRGRARQCEDRLAHSLAASRAMKPGATPSGDSEHLALDEVRGSLPPGAVLLEYYESRGTLYVGILSHDQLRLWPLASSDAVRNALRLFQLQVSKFRLGPEYLKAFRKPMLRAALAHLEELHSQLIAPIRPLLSGRHLIIAPHGFLHNLPFHALCAKGRYLLDDFTISYAPSARVFCLCSTREPTFRNESLVMGVPDSAAPHIEGEARYAAAALPNARLRLGSEATEAAFREYGPASRFVHLAAHGLFRHDNPIFSAIRLGDSDLSLFDLYQLPLSAELVTLSGCDTGLNEVVGGDELLGLIRGLLLAGAHGVLASLWDVHDRSTADFMAVFYSRLSFENKAEALRKAMFAVRERNPHPYYWAPFFLVGKYLTKKNS